MTITKTCTFSDKQHKQVRSHQVRAMWASHRSFQGLRCYLCLAQHVPKEQTHFFVALKGSQAICCFGPSGILEWKKKKKRVHAYQF